MRCASRIAARLDERGAADPGQKVAGVLVVLADAVDEELVVHCYGRVDPPHGERRGQPDAGVPAIVPRVDKGGAADARLWLRLFVVVVFAGVVGAFRTPGCSQRVST